jgi:hypothetical protein
LATHKSPFHTYNGPAAKPPLAGHTTLGPASLKPFLYVRCRPYLYLFKAVSGATSALHWCSSG